MVDIWVEPSVDFRNNKLKVVLEFTEDEQIRSVEGVQGFISTLLYIPPKKNTTTVYCTSRNTGPSYSSDPIHMLYLGTSIDEAEKAVGDFSKYQKGEERWPRDARYYSALPGNMEKEMIQYFMADGWWYSIFMFELGM